MVAVALNSNRRAYRFTRRFTFCVAQVAVCFALTVAARGADVEKEKPEPLPPEEFLLETKDGVEIKATYYPSLGGEKAAALILLHGYRGNRGDFRELATFLQHEHDFAVVVPDLRGHGESTTQVDEEGTSRELKPDRLRAEDFEKMSTEDVEAVKRFLVKQNNEHKLNVERLGVLGSEMGALVGAQWCFEDWDFDQLPTIKQGRDVKALAMISPSVRYKNLSANWLIDEPIRGEIALQIIAGNGNPRALKNAKQVHHLVHNYYHQAKDAEGQRLFLDVGYATSLQGTKMLGEKLGLEARIARFFELQLVEPTIGWKERKKSVGPVAN